MASSQSLMEIATQSARADQELLKHSDIGLEKAGGVFTRRPFHCWGCLAVRIYSFLNPLPYESHSGKTAGLTRLTTSTA